MMKTATLTAMAISLAFVSSATASVTFTDNTFPASNWNNFTPAFEYLSDPSNTVQISQCAACSSTSGQALSIVLGFPNGGGVYNTTNLIGLTNTTFVYNPATQGAITSIDASVEKDFGINV